MNATAQDEGATTGRIDWAALIDSAGPGIAERGAACDADGSFVAENYRELRRMGAFTAHIPAQLGGGGASYEETAGMLRSLARHCGSTALALAMHTHLVAALVFRWQRDP